MALKRKIDKAAYDKLAGDVKPEYRKDGDDFVLDLDGEEDTGALKRAKDREAEAAKREKKRADDLQAEIDELTGNDAKKRGDVVALTEQHKEKMSALKEAHKGETAKLTAQLRGILVDAAAERLANEISVAPALMLPHIKARMDADLSGDAPLTVIKGADGKINPAATLDTFKAELLANKDFSAILKASKASGGGAPRVQLPGQPPVAANGQPAEKVDPSKLGANDMVARINAKKEAAAVAAGQTT